MKVWDQAPPQSSQEHQLVKHTKDLLRLKRPEAGTWGLNSTDVPSPVGPHFPSCSRGGAGSWAPSPAARLAASVPRGLGESPRA